MSVFISQSVGQSVGQSVRRMNHVSHQYPPMTGIADCGENVEGLEREREEKKEKRMDEHHTNSVNLKYVCIQRCQIGLEIYMYSEMSD